MHCISKSSMAHCTVKCFTFNVKGFKGDSTRQLAFLLYNKGMK